MGHIQEVKAKHNRIKDYQFQDIHMRLTAFTIQKINALLKLSVCKVQYYSRGFPDLLKTRFRKAQCHFIEK